MNPLWNKFQVWKTRHHQQQQIESSTESSSSSEIVIKNKKTRSNSSSTETISSSSIVSSPAITPSEESGGPWQKNTQGNLNHFQIFLPSHTIPSPTFGLHQGFVEDAMSEAQSHCGNQNINVHIWSLNSPPYVEQNWSWACGRDTINYHRIGPATAGLWVNSQGCRRGYSCWKWPLESSTPHHIDSTPPYRIQWFPSMDERCLSPLTARIQNIQNRNGHWDISLQSGFRWTIQISGLNSIQNELKIGQIIEVGQSLGLAVANAPVSMLIEEQSLPQNWNQLLRESYP